MSSPARPRPARAWTRLARSLARVLVRILQIVLVALSMGLAAPSLAPRLLRQEDPVVQVEEKEP